MLHLAITAAVIVGVIWALVVFPSFRTVALILVAMGIVAYFVLNEKAERAQKQQQVAEALENAKLEVERKDFCVADQKRWTVVSASQIEIRSPSLTPSQSSSLLRDEYKFAASAKNKSGSLVSSLRMNVTALDCPTQNAREADCDIIGRGKGTFEANIPAGEVRQINGKVRLPDMPKPRAMFVPRFTVSAVRASLDKSDDTLGNDALGWFAYEARLKLYKCTNE